MTEEWYGGENHKRSIQVFSTRKDAVTYASALGRENGLDTAVLERYAVSIVNGTQDEPGFDYSAASSSSSPSVSV